jgi:hypothetical protein
LARPGDSPLRPSRCAASSATAVEAAEIDDAALLRVGQHLVGGADLLELGLRRLVGVDVGVVGARQLAIGALELGVGGVLIDAQQAVIVACHA